MLVATLHAVYSRVSEFCTNRRFYFFVHTAAVSGLWSVGAPEHSLGSLFGDYGPLWAEVEKVGQRAKRPC